MSLSSNYPPEVNASMLPGNSSDDELWDSLVENLEPGDIIDSCHAYRDYCDESRWDERFDGEPWCGCVVGVAYLESDGSTAAGEGDPTMCPQVEKLLEIRLQDIKDGL
jgi:hypothetical protein